MGNRRCYKGIRKGKIRGRNNIGGNRRVEIVVIQPSTCRGQGAARSVRRVKGSSQNVALGLRVDALRPVIRRAAKVLTCSDHWAGRRKTRIHHEVSGGRLRDRDLGMRTRRSRCLNRNLCRIREERVLVQGLAINRQIGSVQYALIRPSRIDSTKESTVRSTVETREPVGRGATQVLALGQCAARRETLNNAGNSGRGGRGGEALRKIRFRRYHDGPRDVSNCKFRGRLCIGS